MLDLHTHVWPHRPGTPTPTLDQLRAYAEAAEARGISQIAITEHSHRFDRVVEEVLPHWDRPRMGPVAAATQRVLDIERGADLDAYVQVLLDAQDEGLPILLGLEVDHLPGTTEAMRSVLDDYPFDVLLGSVHWLDDWLFDAYDDEAFARRWTERDLNGVFEQYVDAVLDLATTGMIDVLAHVDVIKVAGYRPPDLAGIEARLVDGLVEAGVVIEFSSAGLRKPVADTYPGRHLLADLAAAGLGLTTASDAHTVEQIGLGFEVLERELDANGVDDLITFRRRQPIPYHRRVTGP